MTVTSQWEGVSKTIQIKTGEKTFLEDKKF